MAKQKRRFPWFLVGCVVYAAVVLVAAFMGLKWFWTYMEAYETSRPTTAIDAYWKKLTFSKIYDSIADDISQLDTKLQPESETRSRIEQMVKTGISYARNAAESTDDRLVYMLQCDGKTIGKVSMVPGEEDEFGFTPWVVETDSFDFSFLMGVGKSITVPHNYTVTCNGIVLDESYIVKTGIQYETIKELYATYEDLPYMVTYETPGIWGEQVLAVQDPNGFAVTIDENTDMEAFLDTCTAEEKQAAEGYVKDFIDHYIAFIDSTEANREQNYDLLIEFIKDGNPLEERMYNAMEGLYWVRKQKVVLVELNFQNCICLGDGQYLVDLDYTTRATKLNGETEDTKTTSRIILIPEGNSFQINLMVNY